MEAINFNNYYKNLGYNNCLNSPYKYNYSKINRNNKISEDLKEAIVVIKKMIENFKNDKEMYGLLVELTNNDEDIKLIKSIMEDEKRHNKILKELYFELTGNKITESRDNQFEDNMLNYRKNLQKSLEKELDELTKYRKVMAVMPDKNKSLALMEIITNKLKHASLYNFLIAKNM